MGSAQNMGVEYFSCRFHAVWGWDFKTKLTYIFAFVAGWFKKYCNADLSMRQIYVENYWLLDCHEVPSAPS